MDQYEVAHPNGYNCANWTHNVARGAVRHEKNALSNLLN